MEDLLTPSHPPPPLPLATALLPPPPPPCPPGPSSPPIDTANMQSFSVRMQDEMVVVHEPVDVLLTCVRQVLLLAQPRDKHLPDTIVGVTDGGTTPSILRPGLSASQDSNPNQVNTTHPSFSTPSTPRSQPANPVNKLAL